MENEELIQSYLELREKTAARDRGLREKVMSLEEAASFVKDGEHVALGGCNRFAHALRHALGPGPCEA